jgi:hypothetical protein
VQKAGAAAAGAARGAASAGTTLGARVLWDEGGNVNTYRWSEARPAGASSSAHRGPKVIC